MNEPPQTTRDDCFKNDPVDGPSSCEPYADCTLIGTHTSVTPSLPRTQSLGRDRCIGENTASHYSRTVNGIDMLVVLEAIRALEQRRLTIAKLVETQPKVMEAIKNGAEGMGKPSTKSILSPVLSQSWVCSVLVEYHRKPPRQAVEQGQELCCCSSGPVLGPWDGENRL